MSDTYEGDDYDELQYDDDDNGEFDLGKCIDPPTAKLYTTKQLHTLIHEGAIDLNPPYQREVVWPEHKQIRLLDSLWRNYYVPPVVFAVYRDEEGEEVRCCVDGKQRLTSIQKFFDGQSVEFMPGAYNATFLFGQIPYKHWQTGRNYWFTSSNSQKKTRLEVPQRWKKDFSSKTITCVEYHHLPQTLERDIFQRVQMGMALTAAEKLQAISSPWTEWIFELQSRFILADNGLTEKIDVAIKRGQDFQLVAGLVYVCDNYPEQTQPSSKNLDRWLSRMDPPKQQFKDIILGIFTAFWHIANTPEFNRGFREIGKRVAPAEFIFIGMLLYVMQNESYEDRAEAIYQLRVDIRNKFPDIRVRNDIIHELWVYIEGVAEDIGAEQPNKTAAKKTKKARKAKQRDNDDSDLDLDADPRPSKQAKRK